MKFKTEKLHDALTQPLKVGNVYAAKGGAKDNSPRMWVLIALHEKSDGCVLLGLKGDGEICSATKYYRYTIEKWPVVGFCKGIDSLELVLELF